MTQIPPQCQNLREQVDSLLGLLSQEPSLRALNTPALRTSFKKAIDPRFEIVFAGTFSAGKSMLINALLGRNLLYSDIGHATGTECYIEYAQSHQERVELTFLSEAEIFQKAKALCDSLGIAAVDIRKPEAIEKCRQECKNKIQAAGGEARSKEAKQAKALILLLDGFQGNRQHIRPTENATYQMEELGLSFDRAADYARYGSNSGALKRIKYCLHHRLLEDGNVLVDLPGIDAPVQEDAELAYRKVQDESSSAVVCLLKADCEGVMAPEETRLLETIRNNPSIQDRVFYVFNRIDTTWRFAKLQQRLDELIDRDFSDTPRGYYLTSGLLGFLGSLVKNTDSSTRWGLDTIFKDELGAEGNNTPQFVLAFNDYCLFSNKLPREKFPNIIRHAGEPENETYVRIIHEYKHELLDQLIQDSRIQEFSEAINSYLTANKRPELYAHLAKELSKPCFRLCEHYLEARRQLKSQPDNIQETIERELAQVSQDIQEVGEAFYQHMEAEIERVVVNSCQDFQYDFGYLQKEMKRRLDELIKNFSILDAFGRVCSYHRHVTAPLASVLGEGFYNIGQELENVLAEESQTLVARFFPRLVKRVRNKEYYPKLWNLLGDDCGIVRSLQTVEKQITDGLKVLVSAECVFYVLESPSLYTENGVFYFCERLDLYPKEKVWLYQFRETLREASLSRDVQRMVKAEPAIRQLLQIDFDSKVDLTVNTTFRPKLVKMLKEYLLSVGEQQRQLIWQQSDRARANLRQAIENKAQKKIDERNRNLQEVEEKIAEYNRASAGINSCLEAVKLGEEKLPAISEGDASGTAIVIAESAFGANLPVPPGTRSGKFQRGQLVEGTISGFQEDGIIVDVSGTKGVLHIRQVSQESVESLEDLFETGQSLKAICTGYYLNGSISLSTKVLENYPGEILKEMSKVMAEAEERAPEAAQKVLI